LEYRQNRLKDSIALKVLAVSSSHWWQQRCKFASYALFPVVSGAGYLLPEATMETIAGLGMETAVGVGETAVGESVGTVVNSDTAPFGVSAE
jgi:hypothetical protein